MNDTTTLNIGMFGTFDVENYGDLLFPLVAEFELKKRLGDVKIHRFSYHQKTPPTWPYAVTSLTELAKTMPQLDGVLVGGGHIIRFDQHVAPNYFPLTSDISHPTGIWLLPMLMALQQGVPIAWNAPGVLDPLCPYFSFFMQMVLDNSDYISVRDQWAKQILVDFYADSNEKIIISPDTVFSISRLFLINQPTAEYLNLRNALQLTQPYIFIQGTHGLDGFIAMVKKDPGYFKKFKLVCVPIGPILGDSCAYLTEALSNIISLPNWPSPNLMVELIAHAAATVGTSLHLSITSLSFGVPNFRPADNTGKKYIFLSEFESISYFEREGKTTTSAWFQARLDHAKSFPNALQTVYEKIDLHWDRIAELFSESKNKKGQKKIISQKWHLLPEQFDNIYMPLFKSLAITHEKQQAYVDVLESSHKKLENLQKTLSWKLIMAMQKIYTQFTWLGSKLKNFFKLFSD